MWEIVNGDTFADGIMPVAYFTTTMPEIWEGIKADKLCEIEPVTYIKGQCVKHRRYKIFKDTTIMPELWENLSKIQKGRTYKISLK